MNKRAQPLADDPVDLEDRMADIKQQVETAAEDRFMVRVLGIPIGSASDWDDYGTEVGSSCFFEFKPSPGMERVFKAPPLLGCQDYMLIVDQHGMVLEVWNLKPGTKEPTHITWSKRFRLHSDVSALFEEVKED